MIFGGNVGNENTSSKTYSFSFNSNKWKNYPKMKEARESFACAKMYNENLGKYMVVVIGGRNNHFQNKIPFVLFQSLKWFKWGLVAEKAEKSHGKQIFFLH